MRAADFLYLLCLTLSGGLKAYFHVHTPLFTMKHNQGRSRGGNFGDNIEEMDDSVGAILAQIERKNMTKNTMIFLTSGVWFTQLPLITRRKPTCCVHISDNGPYQEEGWASAGRTNLYDAAGNRLGRLKGGKGQVSARWHQSHLALI